jgi:hypothetical protein
MTFVGVADGGTYLLARGLRQAWLDTIGLMTSSSRRQPGCEARFRLCCMDVGYESARTKFPQPNLLFKRYGHNSGVRAPTSGSGQPRRG